YGINSNALYISLDDIYFADNRFIPVAEFYIARGIEVFFLDEVHKYPDWAREIKNIYDLNKKVKVVFTGTCITDILRQNADLSRRAVQYEMPGLSFPEFLNFSGAATLPPLPLKDLLGNHLEIAIDLTKSFKPLVYFRNYLKYGYYPFFKEN